MEVQFVTSNKIDSFLLDRIAFDFPAIKDGSHRIWQHIYRIPHMSK